MTKPRTVKLTPAQLRIIQELHACPDCDSDVRVRGSRVSVAHDDGCPTPARLQRAGLDHGSLVAVKGDDQSAEEFAAEIGALAQEAARPVGGAQVRMGPYDGLGQYKRTR
jgi:hypothetical protein